MTPSPSSIGKSDQQRFGKDHLNLADWRISVPTFQQALKKDGGKVDFAEYAIEQPDGTQQCVTLEAPSRVGLPTAGDEDVVIALLSLAREQEFQSDIVRFTPSQLLRRMRWPLKQESFQRLERALKRLRAVTVTYRHAWYSRVSRAVAPVLITGILAEAKLALRRGRPLKDAVPESYVQWTKHFYESLQDGNLIDLDLDLYFRWARPGSRHLHRHLNKVWHSGRKPRAYERDLKQLACGHLGMTDCKDLKRNFHQLISEMEAKGYLSPMDKGDRYRKIRPGVWRVRLDLSPEFVRIPSRRRKGRLSPGTDEPTEAARALVCLYYRSRFGREAYQPTDKEIAHATKLLSSYDHELLESELPAVARTVAEKFGDDLYFGAAVPFFAAAIEDHSRRNDAKKKQQLNDATQASIEQGITAQKQARSKRRAKLLREWRALPKQTQDKYHHAAIDQATTDFDRSRLRRCSLDSPPLEILELIATEPESQ